MSIREFRETPLSELLSSDRDLIHQLIDLSKKIFIIEEHLKESEKKMREIPTPEEVLKKLDEKELQKYNDITDCILNSLNKFNGKPLDITFYKLIPLKIQNKIKEIFAKKNWVISFKDVSDQRDGNFTNIKIDMQTEENEIIKPKICSYCSTFTKEYFQNSDSRCIPCSNRGNTFLPYSG